MCKHANPAPRPGESADAIMIRGGSCIIGPIGEVLAGPVFDAPAILTSEIDVGAIS